MSLALISSMATRQFLGEAVGAWPAAVAIESVGGVDAARRVHDGEPFDAVVLAADALDKLQPRLVDGSRVVLARSGVAIAVRQGASRPDTGSEDALRRAVLDARAIGCSTGPSGVALQALFARWGLADVLRERLVQAPAGVPVATLLARGDVELGFQQRSELMHADGIEVVGSMPPGLEIVTLFCGAVCAASTQPAAARALLDFLGSAAADGARRRHGLELANP